MSDLSTNKYDYVSLNNCYPAATNECNYVAVRLSDDVSEFTYGKFIMDAVIDLQKFS